MIIFPFAGAYHVLFISIQERKYPTANVRVIDGAWCVRQRSMVAEMYTGTNALLHETTQHWCSI
jgi:hypothetical protein